MIVHVTSMPTVAGIKTHSQVHFSQVFKIEKCCSCLRNYSPDSSSVSLYQLKASALHSLPVQAAMTCSTSTMCCLVVFLFSLQAPSLTKASASSSVVGLSESDEILLLDAHNGLRMNVSNATDMQKMVGFCVCCVVYAGVICML